jgi:hypothetical protein
MAPSRASVYKLVPPILFPTRVPSATDDEYLEEYIIRKYIDKCNRWLTAFFFAKGYEGEIRRRYYDTHFRLGLQCYEPQLGAY